MDEKIIYVRKCWECGMIHAEVVSAQQFVSWVRGELIQNAMPNESATTREFLISGICPECQNQYFGAEDE